MEATTVTTTAARGETTHSESISVQGQAGHAQRRLEPEARTARGRRWGDPRRAPGRATSSTRRPPIAIHVPAAWRRSLPLAREPVNSQRTACTYRVSDHAAQCGSKGETKLVVSLLHRRAHGSTLGAGRRAQHPKCHKSVTTTPVNIGAWHQLFSGGLNGPSTTTPKRSRSTAPALVVGLAALALVARRRLDHPHAGERDAAVLGDQRAPGVAREERVVATAGSHSSARTATSARREREPVLGLAVVAHDHPLAVRVEPVDAPVAGLVEPGWSRSGRVKLSPKPTSTSHGSSRSTRSVRWSNPLE